MGLQNLRNKYKTHPVIKPLIEYCDSNKLSFEFVKETRDISIEVNAIDIKPRYYIQIGPNLINSESEIYAQNGLLMVILEAYKYLDLEFPDILMKFYKIR